MDDMLQRKFSIASILGRNDYVLIQLSIKFVCENKLLLVQVMTWCRPGKKPLPETLISQLTHHSLVMPNSSIDLHQNIGPDNGLLPGGTKPLPEPVLTYEQLSPATFTSDQF